jgi:hypothetical protein
MEPSINRRRVGRFSMRYRGRPLGTYWFAAGAMSGVLWVAIAAAVEWLI